jgi:hypothetical protein
VESGPGGSTIVVYIFFLRLVVGSGSSTSGCFDGWIHIPNSSTITTTLIRVKSFLSYGYCLSHFQCFFARGERSTSTPDKLFSTYLCAFVCHADANLRQC